MHALKDYLADSDAGAKAKDIASRAGLSPDLLPPIAFMAIPSFTHTAKSVPGINERTRQFLDGGIEFTGRAGVRHEEDVVQPDA